MGGMSNNLRWLPGDDAQAQNQVRVCHLPNCLLRVFMYYTSEYGIVFLILENIQKHASFMFLPCLVKKT